MDLKNPHYEPNKTIEWKDQTTELKIMPRNLNIVWGSDKRYWRMPDPSHELNEQNKTSAFSILTIEDQKFRRNSPAELLQVNWLEVTGSVNLNPGGRYEIGFDVSLSADAFGWNNVPMYIMAKLGKKGTYTRKKVSVVNAAGSDDKFDIKLQILSDTNDPKTVYFGLYEVWSGRWKGGLQIYSAFIREV